MPLPNLPEELARYDIALAPLEVGNVFCEAKSELKYFEAALVGVPTVASPTQPFADAIRDGVTGFLAKSTEQWYEYLERLVTDPALRRKIGKAALHDILYRYGPDGRRDKVRAIYEGMLSNPAPKPKPCSVQLEMAMQNFKSALPVVPEFEVICRFGGAEVAAVAVVVPLYNNSQYIVEALDSIASQTLKSIEVIVVDDKSTDCSLKIAQEWICKHSQRFVSVTLLQNCKNEGPSLTRNAGFDVAEAPFVIPLDADDILSPNCLHLLLNRLGKTAAAACHPTLHRFDEAGEIERWEAAGWSPDHLRKGNYIGSATLIRKSAWAYVGGYERQFNPGWEDYEFWCKFVEAGFWSEAVPEAVARYRVHGQSLLHTKTDKPNIKRKVIQIIQERHPWLNIDFTVAPPQPCLSHR
jgi:hypothetical protein